MSAVATIKNNDERVSRRVSLYIKRQSRDGKWVYVILTGTGEDTNTGDFGTRDAALDAIYHAWGAEVWDLQFV